MSHHSCYQQLRRHLAYLKLAAAAEALPAALERAAMDTLTHTEFLEQLLSIEVEATEARRHAGRMRFANFPTPWRISDYDFAAQPSVDQALIRDLATCRYADDATNILFIGPPGVGKTMLATALGHAAVDAGLRVYYTTAADLAARCRKAAIEGRWATTMRYYAGPTVLIIDELGYLPMPADDANALFQVISQRYLKGSIILTTNRGGGKAHRFSGTCARWCLMFTRLGCRIVRGRHFDDVVAVDEHDPVSHAQPKFKRTSTSACSSTPPGRTA